MNVPTELLHTTPVSELTKAAEEYFGGLNREVQPTLKSLAEDPETTSCFVSSDESLWLTREEFGEVERQIETILSPFRSPRKIPDEQVWLVHFIAHTYTSSEDEQEHLTQFPGLEQYSHESDT